PCVSPLFPPCVHDHPPRHVHFPSFPTRRSSDLQQHQHPSSGLSHSCDLFSGSITVSVSGRGGAHTTFDRSSSCSDNCYCTTSGADRKSTRLNSSHVSTSYAVFCLQNKKRVTCHD